MGGQLEQIDFASLLLALPIQPAFSAASRAACAFDSARSKFRRHQEVPSGCRKASIPRRSKDQLKSKCTYELGAHAPGRSLALP
jgi:hypothetical protein